MFRFFVFVWTRVEIVQDYGVCVSVFMHDKYERNDPSRPLYVIMAWLIRRYGNLYTRWSKWCINSTHTLAIHAAVTYRRDWRGSCRLRGRSSNWRAFRCWRRRQDRRAHSVVHRTPGACHPSTGPGRRRHRHRSQCRTHPGGRFATCLSERIKLTRGRV